MEKRLKNEVIICVREDVLVQAIGWCDELLPRAEWGYLHLNVILDPLTWIPTTRIKFSFSSPKVATMFTLKFAYP